MAELNRDFLVKKKCELKHVKLQGYDVHFYLRKLSVRQLKKFAASKSGNNDEMMQMIDAIQYCCVDKDGVQLFAQPDDKELLLDQGMDLINKIFAEIMDYCNVGDAEIDNKAKN